MKKQLMKLEQILEIAEKVQDWQFIIQHAIYGFMISPNFLTSCLNPCKFL
jgi:hypothetical protein